MNLRQIIDSLQQDHQFRNNLTTWHTIPAKEPQTADFPSGVVSKLVDSFARRGIHQLYSHQANAIESVLNDENICVVTPTASGKTMCYNIPVLNQLIKNPNARALYLFPTKALSQDQVHELKSIVDDLEVKIGTYTFDGDTPASARKAVRNAGHIVVTNPDMLHAGILPHHTIWIRLFENLEYVVIDELHHYRGVFGSHLANIIRRLRRICAFYGSDPKFICCSATIANPKELAEKVVAAPVKLVDNNGAPQGERHFLFYNPPVVNAELGIRKSAVKEVSRLTTHFLSKDVQSIVFARSRLRVEILTTYLKDALKKLGKSTKLIKGYRGGYLPTERRAIEQGLRKGEIMSVVSTNALELGIDIGSLDVCIMTGYAGNIASTWQQAGRAGRRSNTSLVILVASSAPLDQYIISHPEYFFEQTPENATIDPNNLSIMTSHIKCAAFELPFMDEESFGLDHTSTQEILYFLEEHRVIRHVRNKWHWSADTYPAEEVSLRTAAPGNVVILDTSDNGRVIGEIDIFAAPTEVYENAIYIHQSEQYTIDRLDLEDRKAYARSVETDYYTDAQIKVDLKVLDTFRDSPIGHAQIASGELSVTWLPTMYKKIKFGTHENVGWGEIHLPETTMHTASYWLEYEEDCGEEMGLSKEELGGAINALAHTLHQVAPVQIMCDLSDIRAQANLKSPFSSKPTIYLYETYPGGVGFSEKLFTHHERLLESAISLLTDCGCKEGCPSCIGSALEDGTSGKNGAIQLAQLALANAVE
jgi:DEAD/DEAH box helicase domain-containing protein